MFNDAVIAQDWDKIATMVSAMKPEEELEFTLNGKSWMSYQGHKIVCAQDIATKTISYLIFLCCECDSACQITDSFIALSSQPDVIALFISELQKEWEK